MFQLLVRKRGRLFQLQAKRYCNSYSGDGTLKIHVDDKLDLQRNKTTEMGFENKLNKSLKTK